MRFCTALALLAPLVAGLFPLPARAVSPCGIDANAPDDPPGEPWTVLCWAGGFASQEWRSWMHYARATGSPGFFVTCTDFTEDTDLSQPGAVVIPGAFSLGLTGIQECTPVPGTPCIYNFLRAENLSEGSLPFVQGYTDHPEDGFPGRGLEFVFDPPVRAWGASFGNAGTGEQLNLVATRADTGSTREFQLDVPGSFGFFAFGSLERVPVSSLRIQSRTLVVGSSGEQFAMGEIGAPPECSDALDNDQDGRTDFPADDGCREWLGPNEAADCNDGLDNDGDGCTDFVDLGPLCLDGDGLPLGGDPGCRDAEDLSEEPDCGDGLDNDRDGFTDHPDDLGCSDALEGSERDLARACDNGMDDDCDGFTDWPEDRGCDDPFDDDEHSPALACDNGLDDDGDDDLRDFSASSDPACEGSGVGDPECLFILDLSEVDDCNDGLDNDGDGCTDFVDLGPLCVDADGLALGGDPGCRDEDDGSEGVDCSDGLDNDRDGFTDFAGADGNHCDPARPEGETDCSDTDRFAGRDDDRGCDSEADASELWQEGEFLPEGNPPPRCDNGLDDDGDGLTDLGEDPGCTTRRDPNESSGQCDNGVDDDQDGFTDFVGGDPDCGDPADPSETSVCSNGVDDDGDGLTDFDGFPDPDTGVPASAPDPGCRDDRYAHSEGASRCFLQGDIDGDGACDFDDNCLFAPNPGQIDTDGDGLGNRCDGDYDDNGVAQWADFQRLLAFWGAREGEEGYDAEVDFDSNNAIGGRDFNFFRAYFERRPGPSFTNCGSEGCSPQ